VGVRRRSFLAGGLAGSVFVACRSWTRPTATTETPDRHELVTLEAMAETFLPGGDGTPGARDANALATIVDPAYGVNPYISEVVSDLDEWCLARFHHVFIELPSGTRELALEQRMGMHGKLIRSLYAPVYEGVLALTKLAFFGGLTNHAGTSYLAFPGASAGYAPASAAGAYAAADTPRAITPGARSAIVVEGPGITSEVRVTAVATSSDDLQATLRVRSPDGRLHELALAIASGDEIIDDVAVPLTGGAAAGTWALEVAAQLGGAGRLELWSLRLRTDLDEAARRP
jgi:hypothetical protein